MDKRILIVIGIFLTGTSICAQKVYFKFNPSYNFATKSRQLSDYELSYRIGVDKLSEYIKNVKTSFGKGYVGNFTIGFVNNKNLSTELVFSYLKGKQTTSSQTLHYYAGDETITDNFAANVISLTPTLVFSRGSDNWKPYLSAGLSINFVSLTNNAIHEHYALVKSENYIIEYKGSTSFGFTTKLGASAKVSHLFSLFGEIGFSYFNFSPNTSEMTEYLYGGEDMLSTISEFDRKTVYEDDIVINYVFVNNEWQEERDDSEPRKRLKFDVPMSYISVSIGLKMDIGKKPEKDAPPSD